MHTDLSKTFSELGILQAQALPLLQQVRESFFKDLEAYAESRKTKTNYMWHGYLTNTFVVTPDGGWGQGTQRAVMVDMNDHGDVTYEFFRDAGDGRKAGNVFTADGYAQAYSVICKHIYDLEPDQQQLNLLDL